MRKEKKGRKQKREEPITEKGNRNIEWDTSSYDNDLSLGGDDDGLDVVG